jgi:hypothetical protein
MADVSFPQIQFAQHQYPKADYSWLSQIPENFWKGQAVGRDNAMRAELAALPKGPDGVPDLRAAASILMKNDPARGAQLLQSLNNQDALLGVRRDELQLQRDKMNQPPDAVKTAQFYAQNPDVPKPQTATSLKADRDQAYMMKGKENLSRVLGRLTDTINELDEDEGIANPDRGVWANAKAFAQSSEVGQKAGTFLATDNQSKRKQMLNMRTVVSNLVRQASGMSAKAFDSNYELQTYLNSIADPQVDKYANLVAIDVLDQTFGLGGLLDQKLPQDVLQKVRAGASEQIQQNPIRVDGTDMENQDVAPASAGDPGNESPYPEVGPQPDATDKQKLMKFQSDPEFRAAFEAKYGKGSVDRWLNNDGWTGR